MTKEEILQQLKYILNNMEVTSLEISKIESDDIYDFIEKSGKYQVSHDFTKWRLKELIKYID
jgi:hypothetical protein